MTELDRERVSDYFARTPAVAEWWNPESGPLQFHYDAELAVLRDHWPLDPCWQVLDVGTGRGRFGAWFAERGCRVLGVDLNPRMVELAREAARRRGVEHRFEVRSGSADDLAALGRERFDAVLCMELFDHLPDLSRPLSQMRAALRPGGRFAFTCVPSGSLYGGLGNAWRWLRARSHPGELVISRTYSLRALEPLLARHGLRLEAWFGIGLLCLNAQTRLLQGGALNRLLLALARAESAFRPYWTTPWIARRGAHVVGLARAE